MWKLKSMRFWKIESPMRWSSLPLLFILANAILAGRVPAEQGQGERLVCCGSTEVVVLTASNPSERVWSWTASDSPEIPKSFHSKFRSTDDCKPYAGGVILITSSSRGVALIERETKRCLFLAEVANAHSACLLPDNQIAVAASTSGDEVQFFSQDDQAKPAKVRQQISLLGAHGTVWDASRKRLWALGTEELLEIKCSDDTQGTGSWTVVTRHALPSRGGHDLSPAHNGSHLYVTTNTQVLRFNRDDSSFKIAEGFGNQWKIKSVDIHPQTQRIVYQQALPDQWWSQTIRFVDAPAIQVAPQRLYKVRWDVPAPRP